MIKTKEIKCIELRDSKNRYHEIDIESLHFYEDVED